MLFLMPCSRRVFFPFLDERFPHLLRRYQERYESEPYLKGPYRDMIRKRICDNSRPLRSRVIASCAPTRLAPGARTRVGSGIRVTKTFLKCFSYLQSLRDKYGEKHND